MNILRALFLVFTFTSSFLSGAINVGIGKTDITPPIGTPSAGYQDRKGEGMEGIHDPLYAIALFIDNGVKQIVLCSVDHLGFTYDMVQEISQQIHSLPELKNCDIFIGSSHTHSGGGAYLNVPLVGESLAGCYDPEVTKFYITKTKEAIIEASKRTIPAKIGIGYGKAEGLSKYRGLWPIDTTPLSDVAIIKITHLDGSPLAVLFNYPVHPTVLKSQNRLFSADFVGYARNHLQAILGDLEPIFFNGAQGDIIPSDFQEEGFTSCDLLGKSLARQVAAIYHQIDTMDLIDIQTAKETYCFKPQPTPFGLLLPLENYTSEVNVIVFNQVHAFITIPGELSCLYDRKLKNIGKELGYEHVSIFGLTNDAHGYIILPASWRNKTNESKLSFGGENYGESMIHRIETLLKKTGEISINSLN